MATMARAGEPGEVACCTTKEGSQQILESTWSSDMNSPYGLSRKAPSAGSYKPPGTGCNNVSKVDALYMHLTLSAFISSELRNPKLTPLMADKTGAEIFIA